MTARTRSHTGSRRSGADLDIQQASSIAQAYRPIGQVMNTVSPGAHPTSLADPGVREFRLDDDEWRARHASARKWRWPLALAMAILTSASIVRFGFLGLTLEGVAILGLAAVGAGAAMFLAVGTDRRPIRLEISPFALLFYRPSGKRISLPLTRGTKIRLLDQSIHLSRLGNGRLGQTHTPYFMSHSATTELIPLTRESFMAIQRDLVSRGAVLGQKRTIPMSPDSVAWEYRL